MSTQAYAANPESSKLVKLFDTTVIFKGINAIVKRLFDIVTALIGLIVLSPFFVFIAILIKKDSPGPVFYWGPRVGRKGKIFQILKFRTMYENPESYKGPRVTSKDDPRITPFGNWLRETKVNELPQLWNVLKGEMSMVGPRPEDPEIAKNWPAEARSKVLSIRPGITSPASVLYHDEEKLLSQKNALSDYYLSILPNKLRLDQLYVSHHSFFSDLDTIFWTAAVIVPRFGAITIPEGYFFAGPFSQLGHRYVSWFFIDAIEALAVSGLAAVIWRTRFPLNWGILNVFVLGIILAFLFGGVNYITGLNKIVWSHATGEDVVGLILTGGFVTAVSLVLNYLNANYIWVYLPPLPPTMLIVIGVLSQSCFIATRYRLRLLTMVANRWLNLRRNAMTMGDRVLVVGDGEAGQIATWLLGRQLFRGAFSIIGIVNDSDPRKYGMKVEGNWMLGSLNDIPQLIKTHDIGVIVFAGPTNVKEINEYIFDICQINNIRLFFLNDLMLMVDRQVTRPRGSFEYPVWVDERLEYKAMHNDVTGLPNRYLFQDRLKHSLAYAKRYKTQLAVLLIKIDVNKINEEYGRKYGNQILAETAQRLKNCHRESDTLAYVADNLYAVILQNIADEAAVEMVARKLYSALSAPYMAEKHELRLEPEMKIYKGAEGYNDIESLCKNDIGLAYAEKQKTTEVLNWYDNAIEG
jgi:diguanylate cyclase (GGDEF)-like protein